MTTDFYLAEDSTINKLYLLRTFDEKNDDQQDEYCTICLYNSDEETDDETEQNLMKPTMRDTKRYCQIYSRTENDSSSQPVCKHYFHTICLYDWFKTSKKILCPLCKQGMSDQVRHLPALYRTPPVTVRQISWFTGNLIIYETVDGVKHGLYREFYGLNEHQPKTRCHYVDGRMHGESRTWYDNGQLCDISHWQHGRQVGTVRCYSKQGKPTLIANFDNNGNYHGRYKAFDMLYGRPVEKGTYSHGKQVGLWKKYFITNQQVREVIQFDNNGMRHGKTIHFYLNGNIAKIVSYQRGVQRGLERQWYTNGQIRHWSYWNPTNTTRQGLEVGWFSNGKVRYICFHDDNGMYNGPYLEWDIHGRILYKHLYVGNQKHGKQITYEWNDNDDNNGNDAQQHKTLIKYVHGIPHGPYIRKFPNGDKIKGRFKHGRMISRNISKRKGKNQKK